MSSVLDASALLAYLQNETGAGVVEAAMLAGDAVCGAANWSEVSQQPLAKGHDFATISGFLLGHQLVDIVPVTRDDAIKRSLDKTVLAINLILGISDG